VRHARRGESRAAVGPGIDEEAERGGVTVASAANERVVGRRHRGRYSRQGTHPTLGSPILALADRVGASVEPLAPGWHPSTAHRCPFARRRLMKRMFATVVVALSIAGCTTGQGVATGAAASPGQASAPIPSPARPGPTGVPGP